MTDAVKDLENYDRVLQTALNEIQSTLERQVDLAFKGLSDDPDAPLPWIGHWPHDRPVQKRVVVAALTCRHWAKFELPRWAPELPLLPEDCRALWNTGDRRFTLVGKRLALVGQYAAYLRELWWKIDSADRFEVFCESLAPQSP
jgi:hypothetical protein